MVSLRWQQLDLVRNPASNKKGKGAQADFNLFPDDEDIGGLTAISSDCAAALNQTVHCKLRVILERQYKTLSGLCRTQLKWP